MVHGEWIPATTPPTQDGCYMVRLYLPNRHPTDRIEIVYREYKDGQWIRPYYDSPNEGSELTAWQECNL